MDTNSHPYGFGWLKDHPDIRDYSPEHADIKKMFKGTKLQSAKPLSLPSVIDLRPWCTPVENQGALGSCTANAGVGLLEYYEKRAYGKYLDGSRLFLYKATRDYMGWVGDTGAFLRSTMGALRLFGVPPEKYWPYDIAKFDVEPSAFLYSFAENYKAISYYRLDPIGTTSAVLLQTIKNYLAAGLPSMFGFTVYQSFYQAATTGKVPFPSLTNDKVVGGHAVVVVGYDDTIKIQNTAPGSVATTGAFLIRNSWGQWGTMQGYIWMPYDYVLKGLARDFWTLFSAGYVDSNQFDI